MSRFFFIYFTIYYILYYFYYYGGKENCLLYRALRYIEVLLYPCMCQHPCLLKGVCVCVAEIK